jgi:hypothetical protein
VNEASHFDPGEPAREVALVLLEATALPRRLARSPQWPSRLRPRDWQVLLAIALGSARVEPEGAETPSGIASALALVSRMSTTLWTPFVASGWPRSCSATRKRQRPNRSGRSLARVPPRQSRSRAAPGEYSVGRRHRHHRSPNPGPALRPPKRLPRWTACRPPSAVGCWSSGTIGPRARSFSTLPALARAPIEPLARAAVRRPPRRRGAARPGDGAGPARLAARGQAPPRRAARRGSQAGPETRRLSVYARGSADWRRRTPRAAGANDAYRARG